jgi:nicotinamide-nucleotide amidase
MGGFMSDPISPEEFRALHYELANNVITLLNQRGWTISAAESCTGGLFLGALTEIPGCSASVVGGVVSYSNPIKEEWVGVKAETLAQYGAVSEQTAREMAQGIRERMKTTIGVGITGIAGPGGGSAEKPVGLVYVGVATPEGVEIVRLDGDHGRATNRAGSVEQALQMTLAAITRDMG